MDYKEKLQSMSGFIGDVRKIPKEINKHTKMLCWKYNQTSPLQLDDRKHILRELFGSYEDTTVVQPPVRMDFGFNIHFKGWAYINYGCIFLDTSPIMIGEGVFIAPGVILTCATHPVDEKQRVDEGLKSLSLLCLKIMYGLVLILLFVEVFPLAMVLLSVRDR